MDFTVSMMSTLGQHPFQIIQQLSTDQRIVLKGFRQLAAPAGEISPSTRIQRGLNQFAGAPLTTSDRPLRILQIGLVKFGSDRLECLARVCGTVATLRAGPPWRAF